MTTLLNPRQMAFVRAYLSDPTRNATQAYLKAGYSATLAAAVACSSALLKNKRVRELIEQHDASSARVFGVGDVLVDGDGNWHVIRGVIVTEWRPESNESFAVFTAEQIGSMRREQPQVNLNSHLSQLVQRALVGSANLSPEVAREIA